MEWLEVTRTVSTAMSDGQAFDRLLLEAEELAAEPAACPPETKSTLPPYRLVLGGASMHFPDCTDARASLLVRMSRLLRKVQER
jgi:hypothetical protein